MGGGDLVAEVESEGLCDVENTVFVAVGKNVKESKTTLFWASHSFPGKKICILHVHQPAHLINLMNAKFSVNKLKKQVVKTWRETERRKMQKLLCQYLDILSQMGVKACKVWIEMDNVERGIVQIILHHNVRRLVMGAAADEHHTEELSELKSKKATFVCHQAPDSCHIWFACNGHLIYARCGGGSSLKQMALLSSTSGSGARLLLEDANNDQDETKKMLTEPNSPQLVHSSQLREMAEEYESLNETKLRQELEKTLENQKQEIENMKKQYDKYVKELQMIHDQKPELEHQLMQSQSVEEELEEKIVQAVNLLVTFKEKRDNLKIERDNVTRDNEELRNLVAGNSSLQLFEFSFWEINEATNEFDPSWKIGDGKFGSVYKGFLRNLKVAIKMLPSHGCQSPMDFENEARLLSKIRHPNLVTLIGTCTESRSVIYEYLENKSLEDHLLSSTLSWQTRVKVTSEICSALIFLHSNKPSIIHGNLRPSNILFDANFVSKISDVGMYRMIPKDIIGNYLTSLSKGDDLEASAYIDPEVSRTGDFTRESDIYSFGVILLRSLTGRSAIGVLNDVKCALVNDNFSALLDLNAGKWPIEQAKNLATLALRCCENEREDRTDLILDVLSETELMKEFCISSDLEAKGTRQVPSHFVCPIFQEIMKDPYIAPDGFTYEEDAIKGWFNSGHNTSPMTNLKLENCDLLPNYALYNAIQEWEQQS